jgi:hypothetical protein
MTTRSDASASPRLSPTRAIVYGGLLIGLLDGADAVLFFGLRGAQPLRIFQGIASGILGAAAFEGGIPTAVLGVGLHFFIAFAIMAAGFAAGRRIPFLVQRPLLSGAMYGVGVYLFMNAIVLPLAGLGGSVPPLPVLANGLLIHIFGVGIPCMFFTRAAVVPAPSSDRLDAHGTAA